MREVLSRTGWREAFLSFMGVCLRRGLGRGGGGNRDQEPPPLRRRGRGDEEGGEEQEGDRRRRREQDEEDDSRMGAAGAEDGEDVYAPRRARGDPWTTSARPPAGWREER